MTPRQLAAYMELGFRRRMGWQAELLNVIQVGTSHDTKAITKLMRSLNEIAS